ncbi:hypothetical protein [Galbibacter sp. PAP.153]
MTTAWDSSMRTGVVSIMVNPKTVWPILPGGDWRKNTRTEN